jgi:hypothetical protein
MFSEFFPHVRRSRSANCAAADMTESTAALVSFQWHQPSIPPGKNVNSAVLRELPACHFGGLFANCAISESSSVFCSSQWLIFFASLHLSAFALSFSPLLLRQNSAIEAVEVLHQPFDAVAVNHQDLRFCTIGWRC